MTNAKWPKRSNVCMPRRWGGERVNLLPALIEAARAYATLGEMMGTVRIAYGQPYDPMGVLAPPRL